MITIPLSKLFIGYVKAVTFKEVKTYIESILNLKSEVTTSQHCYGDLDDYSWETFKFYFKDINTLFKIILLWLVHSNVLPIRSKNFSVIIINLVLFCFLENSIAYFHLSVFLIHVFLSQSDAFTFGLIVCA